MFWLGKLIRTDLLDGLIRYVVWYMYNGFSSRKSEYLHSVSTYGACHNIPRSTYLKPSCLSCSEFTSWHCLLIKIYPTSTFFVLESCSLEWVGKKEKGHWRSVIKTAHSSVPSSCESTRMNESLGATYHWKYSPYSLREGCRRTRTFSWFSGS